MSALVDVSLYFLPTRSVADRETVATECPAGTLGTTPETGVFPGTLAQRADK